MRDTEDELPDGSLSCWQEHSNDIRSNNVAKMALEVFGIPAMSADPERLFSKCISGSLNIYSNHTLSLIADISFLYSTKLRIIDQRNRLGDEVIEASECLKSWEHPSLSFSSRGSSSMASLENTLKALEVPTSTMGGFRFN